MQELKSIEKKYDMLNKNLKTAQICYNNIQIIHSIMNELNNLNNSIINQRKDILLNLYKKELKWNLDFMIALSYKFLETNKYLENEHKIFLLNIQANYPEYPEYQNNSTLKLIEFEMIMQEAKEKNDYYTALHKFQTIKKNIYDKELLDDIENRINDCEIEIAEREQSEIISKYVEKKNYENAKIKYENLIKVYQDRKYVLENILNNYLNFLECIIESKIKEGIKDIKEIKIYSYYINENRKCLKDYKYYKIKLEKYIKRKITIKNKIEDEKKIRIELNNNNNNDNNNNCIIRDRNAIEYYLKEIEKCISYSDLEKFEECKRYIYEQINNYEDEEKNNFRQTGIWFENRDYYSKEIRNIKNIGRIYSYFNKLNKEKAEYDIYTIQLISLLILSQELPESIKGIFCKINTGEGKTTIIQFLAAYNVLLGNKVDIVSSSLVLASRDAKKREFFDALKIKVNVLKEVLTENDDPYSADIVYGDANNFSADILKEEYELTPTRRNRGFDVVIIDEVDNMCIDNLKTKTQLTKRFPGYQSLYTFYYALIFSFNYIAHEMKLTDSQEELESKRSIIKKAIIDKLKDNPFELENKLTNEIELKKAVKKYLNNVNSVNKDESKENDGGEEKKAVQKIQKLLTQDGKLFEVEGKNVLGILYPNYLKKEIESSIENWIDSIITAFGMIENKHYRIIKEKGYKKIVPIDFSNTGVSQINMVWNEGLHQVLQIINDVEVFPENINTNFLYTMTYFKKYKQLYGLTGTIGSKTNQLALKDLYKVNLYFIPPNLKSQLTKKSEIVFTEQIPWEKYIIKEIKNVLEENRSVLLICKTIKDGEHFLKLIKEAGINNIKIYFSEENQDNINEILNPKYVIIATNLAGRGTDIKLSKELEESGGLHVIVSFLPLNQRVEDQNYGRAGRNGKKGSYSLIFTYFAERFNPLLTVDSIKRQREEDERKAFDNFKGKVEKDMLNEESLFKIQCNFRKELEDKKNNGMNIYLADLIKEDEEYAWSKIINSNDTFEEKKKKLEKLIENSTKIINPLIKIKYYIKNIEEFKEEQIFEEEKFYSWPLKIEYASHLAIQKEIDKALSFYESAIEDLKDFQIDIGNQTVLYMLIFKSLAKNEKFNFEKNKTRIEKQNERKKQVLQVIIDYITQNIKVLEQYQKSELKEKSYIEEEMIDITKICRKININKYDNPGEFNDLTIFINEFGIEGFQVIRFVECPDFTKNYIVFSVGILETAVGALACVLSAYTGSTKIGKLAVFLVSQGLEDIYVAFENALNRREINLKNWGGKKAISYLTGIIKIVIGGTGSSITSEITSTLKSKIFDVTCKYVSEKATDIIYNQLIEKGGSKIKEYCNDYIGKPICNHLISKYSLDTKSIVLEKINNENLIKEKFVSETKEIFYYIKNSSLLLSTIKNKISKLMKEELGLQTILKGIVDLISLYRQFGPYIKNFYKTIKNPKKDLDLNFKPDKYYYRFDGTLKSFWKLYYKSYDETKSEIVIDSLCQNLIKYNVIDKNGKLDKTQINNEELEQIFFFEINKEFQDIIPEEGKQFMASSDKLLGLDFKKNQDYIQHLTKISPVFGKKNINLYKEEIEIEITKIVLANVKYICQELINILTGKIKEKVFEKNIKKEQKRIKSTGKKDRQSRGLNQKDVEDNNKMTSNFINQQQLRKTQESENKPKPGDFPNLISLTNDFRNKDEKPKEKSFKDGENPNKKRRTKNKNYNQILEQNAYNSKSASKNKKSERIPQEETKNNEFKKNPDKTKNYNNYNTNIYIENNFSDSEKGSTAINSLILDSPNDSEENLNEEYNEMAKKYHFNDYISGNEEDINDECDEMEKKNKFNYNISGNEENINNECKEMIFKGNINNIININTINEEEKTKNSYNKNNNNNNSKSEFNITQKDYRNYYDGLYEQGLQKIVNKEKKIYKINNNIYFNQNKNKKKSKPVSTSKISEKIEKTVEVMATPICFLVNGAENLVNDTKKGINNNLKKIKGGFKDLRDNLKIKKLKVQKINKEKIIKALKLNKNEIITSFKDYMKREGVENLLDYINSKSDLFFSDKKEKIYTEQDLKKIDNKNKDILIAREIKENQENSRKLLDEKIKKDNLMKEGKKEWNSHKKKFIEIELREINFLDLLEEVFIDYYYEIKSNVLKEIQNLFKTIFSKEEFSLLIQKKHIQYFNIIKNEIHEIETLNYMVVGFTGSGKSCLVNILLKKYLAKEGPSVNSETQLFTRYISEKVPGLTLYDTIGVETTNINRNLEEIKKMIIKIFDASLKDPKRSLHGILYCINNGTGQTKISNEEIYFIQELKKLNGSSNNLIILFTQTINKNEKRKNELKQQLNNDNIEIVEILAKDVELKFGNQSFIVKANGIDKLYEIMKKKYNKNMVSEHLKQIIKTKIKENFSIGSNNKYIEMKNNIKNCVFEKNVLKEFQFIVNTLIGDYDLNLNCDKLDKIISNYTEIIEKQIINSLLNQNKNKIMEKIKQEFIIINAKYDNSLKNYFDAYEEAILKSKFEEYFIPKIKEEIEKLFLEKVYLIFLEESKNILSKKISENVKNEEINDLVDLNIEKILKKINN